MSYYIQPNLDEYCLCDIYNISKFKEKGTEATLISKEATLCRKKRDRKRNKEIFRPLILESVDYVLKNIVDESDLDEILFRRADKS